MNILSIEIHYEQDLVHARQRARQVAELLGFDSQDQTRVSTAVSEIVRNAFQYAGGGRVELSVDEEDQSFLVIRIIDHGPGIRNLKEVLDGRYKSETGMGLGIIGSKRLMDRFSIDSSANGTSVTLGKKLPKSIVAFDARRIAAIVEELARRRVQSPLEEVQAQNQQLVSALGELRTRQAELAQLNRELEETNRGVVALYAELDEKAESLRKASEAKSSFLSNMTHEFRTPVNSIMNLSRLLVDRIDGDLNNEQEKQVLFIQRAASDLSDLVNDLLDLAKVEAGKVSIRVSDFTLSDLVGGLRGILRPLSLGNPNVELVFDERMPNVSFSTDEGKVSQILRNLISNALKYTVEGEVRLSAHLKGESQLVFSVSDTGIGIAPDDHERIFEEFAQVDSQLQRRVKGTGLGLPLSRKLAQLLGGRVTMESAIGQGSTFHLELPIVYAGAREPRRDEKVSQQSPSKILVIDDDEISRYLLAGLVSDAMGEKPYTLLEAKDGTEGIHRARELKPDVIFLDLTMPDVTGFEVLAVLKSSPETGQIPIVINSSARLAGTEFHRLTKAIATLSKECLSRGDAVTNVRDALVRAGVLAQKTKEVVNG